MTNAAVNSRCGFKELPDHVSKATGCHKAAGNQCVSVSSISLDKHQRQIAVISSVALSFKLRLPHSNIESTNHLITHKP